MELSMEMTPRVEVEEDSDNNKGSMWDLDQKLDQPMDEEAGRLRNIYREKVLEYYNFPSLSLTHPISKNKPINRLQLCLVKTDNTRSLSMPFYLPGMS